MDRMSWVEPMLELALQRDLEGFEVALKHVMATLPTRAWACLFPPSFGVGSRSLLITHNVEKTGPVMTQGVISDDGEKTQDLLQTLAAEMAPRGARWRLIRLARGRQSALCLFLYRQARDGDFSQEELREAAEIGSRVDRCYVNLAGHLEQEFLSGLLRLVSNLATGGLCVLDARRRLIFENRVFREHMLAWVEGGDAVQNLSLPRQSALPEEWQRACETCFDAMRQSQMPPGAGKMTMTQGPVVSLRNELADGLMLGGGVRYIVMQNRAGLVSYLLLTSDLQRPAPETVAPEQIAAVPRSFAFSRREDEVAQLVLQGLSAAQMGEKLGISLPTVKSHIQNILRKAGTKTRLQFVSLVQRGLLKEAEEAEAASAAQADAPKSSRIAPPARLPPSHQR